MTDPTPGELDLEAIEKSFVDGYYVGGRDPVLALFAEIRKLRASAQCCRWEADNARLKLPEELADEFPFGCDTIIHVGDALLAARERCAALEAALVYALGVIDSAMSLDIVPGPDMRRMKIARRALSAPVPPSGDGIEKVTFAVDDYPQYDAVRLDAQVEPTREKCPGLVVHHDVQQCPDAANCVVLPRVRDTLRDDLIFDADDVLPKLTPIPTPVEIDTMDDVPVAPLAAEACATCGHAMTRICHLSLGPHVKCPDCRPAAPKEG